MKNFKNWIPTSVVIVAIFLVLHYTGVLNSKFTVGIVLTVFALLLFVSVWVTPPHKEE
jgi:hypothetical protein